MEYSIRQQEFELQNNFLTLNIDWFEELARNSDAVFPFHRNVLNFICESAPGATGYFEDVARSERLMQQSGDVVLIPAGLATRHRLDESIRLVTIHFSLEFISGLDLFQHADRIFRFHDPELTAKIRALPEEPDAVKAMLELRTEVQKICLRFYPGAPSNAFSALARYSRCLDWYSARVDAATSVNDMARTMHCSRECFSRNFRRDVGIAPTAWLHRVLTNRIAGLLNHPHLTVKEIAGQLHFSSEFYLSRFFKRQTGVSPREYRSHFRISPKPE